MRKLKLLIASCALLLGVGNASAYTVDDLTSAGWTQVTDATITGIADNYYMLVDANSSAYVMSAEADHYRPCYKTINNPVENPSFVWILESSGDKFNLKSASTGAYFKQASGWNTSVGDGRNGSTASLEFTTLPDGKYSIQCVGQGLVGHWNDNGAAVASDGENIAANKAAKDAPGFYLYSISKATYNAALVAARATEVSSATKASPLDVTSYIQNADWSGDWGAWEFTCTSSGNIQWGQKTLESWNANNVVVKQVLTGVPNGLYKLSADVISGNNDNKVAYVYAIGDTKVSSSAVSAVASAGNYTTMSNEVAGNTLTADNVSVTGNSLTVGIDQSAGWIVADNFKLYYYGPTVAGNAIALPDGGAMAAGQWYFFDVETAADNYTATATTLGDIIYTTAGSTLIEDELGITDNFTEENNSLSATRYYVKSSSAQSLAIAPASYSYSISEASANVSYIQAGNTVTVSYTTSTNDPDATLTQDYNGITFGGKAISVTPTASGFTFTIPTVTANTDYTLSIPAGAIKYNEENTNAAQDITLKTPAVLDGTYFLKAAATYDGSSEGTSAAVGKYMARGTAYSTHLSLDSYGLPVAITTDGSNQTILKMADTNGYVFSTGSYDAYADGSDAQKTSFTISVQNSKYLIASNNRGADKYLKYNTANAGDEEISVFDDGIGTNSGPIIMWAIESISEHATAMQAKKDTQAAAAAAAAYASGNYASLNGITTVTALESELTAHYIDGAFVSPSTITSVEESYQPRNNTEKNLLPVTVYSSTINITEAGFYKFSMQAFNRATWNENVQAMHDVGADMPAAVLFFGDSETQIKSLYDEDGHDTAVEGANPADAIYNGKYYANCKVSALKMFKDDKYHNDVWFYCSTPGTYTYGVKVMGYASGQWFIYSPQSVTITSYAAAASTADYTALQGAIEAYDAATWGFEAGEYAPYNNLEAINNIAAAKAIDSEKTNSKLLVNSLSAKIALTANTDRMNAIGYGDFATYETIAGKDYPYGWNLSPDPSNPSNLSRIMGGSEGSNNAGLSASKSGKALLIKFNATYGDTEGYTMPLKANTVYKLSFKYCGWGNDALVATNVVMTAPDNSEITLAPGFTPIAKNGEKDATLWSEYTGYFVTTTAGNYKLNLNKSATEQHQIAIADIDLQVGPQYLTFTDDAVPTYAPGTYPSVRVSRTFKANKWATAVYPFAITAATDGIDEIATLESFSDDGTLGFSTTGGVSTANEPFMMRTAVDGEQMFSWGGTGSEVQVYAAAETPTVTKGSAKLIGAYAATPITNAEKNYVLSSNTIYPVGDAGATIPAYRAYIQIAQTVAARSLKFVIDGEETTGIDGIAAESVSRGEVYNLNGQRVASPRKGLYIQNGKKVLVK